MARMANRWHIEKDGHRSARQSNCVEKRRWSQRTPGCIGQWKLHRIFFEKVVFPSWGSVHISSKGSISISTGESGGVACEFVKNWTGGERRATCDRYTVSCFGGDSRICSAPSTGSLRNRYIPLALWKRSLAEFATRTKTAPNGSARGLLSLGV